MHSIGEYIEHGYNGHDIFLSDDEYSHMLDAVVIACVDVLIVSPEGRIILGRRAWHPQKDWWLFGGRMKTGESMTNAARRLITVELNLSVDEERFSYVTSFSAAWRHRAHHPVDHGTHTVSTVYILQLSNEEFERMLPNKEYEETTTFTVESIQNGDFHPALKQCVNAYLHLNPKLT